ncbi:MAG: hypothetical protein WCK67_09485 [bacterium]
MLNIQKASSFNHYNEIKSNNIVKSSLNRNNILNVDKVNFKGENNIEIKDVREFKKAIPSILMQGAESTSSELYEKFNLNGVGITKVKDDYALSLYTETQKDKNKILKVLSGLK